MQRSSIAAISLLIASSSASAVAFEDNKSDKYDYHKGFSTSCDSNFNGEMSFTNNTLTVITEENETLLFDANGRVLVDGKLITLNASEQASAQQYFASVERAIPMVTTIAIEAINITNLALTETFTALLGDDSQLPKTINDKLSKLAKGIESHVYQNPESLTFDSAYFENDLGFDNNIEQEIEEMTEEMMSSAVGEVLMALGKAMMSGGDTSDFETRMENMGKDIELRAEALAKELEAKAENLCGTLREIDDTENQLQSVEALRHLNMVDVHKQKA